MSDTFAHRGPTTVTVLGAGAMGRGLVANLAAAGHDVCVWSRTRGSAESAAAAAGTGVDVAPTARDAARNAAVVIAMVTDDDASRSVWLDPDRGVLESLAPGAIAIESSTVSPPWAIELGAAAASRGADLLEAPVLGSTPQLAARALHQLVGGDERTLARARPVLEASASVVTRVGAVGDASRLKLVVNGLLAIQVAALAELVGVIDRSPIDRRLALEVLEGLAITSPALRRTIGLVGEAHVEAGFPLDLVAKDLGYLTALADDLDTPAALAGAAHRLVADDLGAIGRREDLAALARRYLRTAPPTDDPVVQPLEPPATV